jgi:hypothetical protein
MSRIPAKRPFRSSRVTKSVIGRLSALAGWANYDCCPSHSRWFWGLRLYLIATPAGMPVTCAFADPKLDERTVLAAMLDLEPELAAARPGLVLIADKGFKARWFETSLDRRGIDRCAPRCATSHHGPAGGGCLVPPAGSS